MNIELGLKGLQEAINIHPLSVHFPIALLLTSLGFYFIGSIIKKDEFLLVGKWLLFVGTIAAAVLSGRGFKQKKQFLMAPMSTRR